jgi:hypothetical protein
LTINQSLSLPMNAPIKFLLPSTTPQARSPLIKPENFLPRLVKATNASSSCTTTTAIPSLPKPFAIAPTRNTYVCTTAWTSISSNKDSSRNSKKDNEASKALKRSIRGKGIDYQLVPPHIHRRNDEPFRRLKINLSRALASPTKNFHFTCGIAFYPKPSQP